MIAYAESRYPEGFVRQRALAHVSRIYDTLQRVFALAREGAIPTYRAADQLAEQRIASVRLAKPWRQRHKKAVRRVQALAGKLNTARYSSSQRRYMNWRRKEKPMAVYFIVDVNIDDPQSYAEYNRQVGPMVARYGGRFLVRGGTTSTIEGDWQPQRLVVIEFADTEHFRAWYDSPEYAEVRTIRFQASTARAVLAQGVEQR